MVTSGVSQYGTGAYDTFQINGYLGGILQKCTLLPYLYFPVVWWKPCSSSALLANLNSTDNCPCNQLKAGCCGLGLRHTQLSIRPRWFSSIEMDGDLVMRKCTDAAWVWEHREMVCREMQVRRGKRQRGEAFSLFMWNLLHLALGVLGVPVQWG